MLQTLPPHVTDLPHCVTDPPLHVTNPPLGVTDRPPHVTDHPPPLCVTDPPLHVTHPPLMLQILPLHVTDPPLCLAQTFLRMLQTLPSCYRPSHRVTDHPPSCYTHTLMLQTLPLRVTDPFPRVTESDPPSSCYRASPFVLQTLPLVLQTLSHLNYRLSPIRLTGSVHSTGTNNNFCREHSAILFIPIHQQLSISRYSFKQKSKLIMQCEQIWPKKLQKEKDSNLGPLSCEHLSYCEKFTARINTDNHRRRTYLYDLVEDVYVNLFRDDVLFVKVAGTVDVTHPVGGTKISGIDIEQKLLRLLVYNLTQTHIHYI